MQQNADNEGKHGDHVDHEGQIENERTHGSRAYPSEMGFPAPQSDENGIDDLGFAWLYGMCLEGPLVLMKTILNDSGELVWVETCSTDQRAVDVGL